MMMKAMIVFCLLISMYGYHAVTSDAPLAIYNSRKYGSAVSVHEHFVLQVRIDGA